MYIKVCRYKYFAYICLHNLKHREVITKQKVQTRFMIGNKTEDVFDIMLEEYGYPKVCNHYIDYNEAIFSDGFIAAIERGQMPLLGSEKEAGTCNRHGGEEYHHLIYNDVCYIVYFTEE